MVFVCDLNHLLLQFVRAKEGGGHWSGNCYSKGWRWPGTSCQLYVHTWIEMGYCWLLIYDGVGGSGRDGP